MLCYLRRKDLGSCSCVCRKWNALITDSKELNLRRDELNVYDTLYLGKTIYLADTIGSGLCVGPHENTIIVSDALNNRVGLFDLQGQLILFYGSESNATAKFSNPTGVCRLGSVIFMCRLWK